MMLGWKGSSAAQDRVLLRMRLGRDHDGDAGRASGVAP